MQADKYEQAAQEQEGPQQEQQASRPASVHTTPPGHWPSSGPQPSKFAVLLFYISIIATTIGALISIRTAFYVKVSLFKHDQKHTHKPLIKTLQHGGDQIQLFFTGCGLVGTGLMMLTIANFIYNRERRNILAYLDAKIEELQMDENSRAKRNLRHSAHLKDEQQNLA